MHKLLPKIVFGLICISLVISPTSIYAATAAELQQQLEAKKKELEGIRNQKKNLNSTITNQQGQIGIYQGQVGKLRKELEELQLTAAEYQLQLDQLNISIQLVEGQIADKEKEMKEKEIQMASIEDEAEKRIINNYIDYRSRGQTRTDFFRVKNVNTYFKDSQYQNIIQANSQEAVNELQKLKEELLKDKAELEEKRVDVKRDKAVVDEQKSQLDKLQSEVSAKIDGYYGAIYTAQSAINNSKRSLSMTTEAEAKKMAEVEKLQQAIFNSFNSIPNGQYVIAGTQIGRQGATGWATGPHLHFAVAYNGGVNNPCMYLPGNFVAGCGGNGSLQAPIVGNIYYTSRFYSGYNGDYRCYLYNGKWTCDTHQAIDVAHSVWNAPIFAAHDGWLVKGVDQYGALYIIICQNKNNCNSGFKTSYWHLSSY